VLNPFAFQLVALDRVGAPATPLTASFGGAVALVRSSYVNFLNVDNFTMGDTLSVAMASNSDLFFFGSSASNLTLEVEGTFTNHGTWDGNVVVGGYVSNYGTIMGNVTSGGMCSSAATVCSPPSVTGTVSQNVPYSPSVDFTALQEYYSCLSFSASLLNSTVSAVSYSKVKPNSTSCAIALSAGRNVAYALFSGIDIVTLGGGDSTSVLFLNVNDTGTILWPATWQIPGNVNKSAIIVNVLQASVISGFNFTTPIIAQGSTLTGIGIGGNVTISSTVVVKSLGLGTTYSFSPTSTSDSTVPSCYQSPSG